MSDAVKKQDRYKSVLLFGAPGVGKGTQGAILGRIPGFWHFSCGDVFRRINPNSELGRIFMKYSSQGKLVPDDVTVRMWTETIQAHVVLGSFKPESDLLILDGIPRTLDQAQLMDEHIEVLKVIHLVCTNEEAMFERLRRRALKENRIDDADERVIRKRWDVYEKETAPVLKWYAGSRVVNIDSLRSPGMVLHDVLEQVVPLQDAHFRNFEA